MNEIIKNILSYIIKYRIIKVEIIRNIEEIRIIIIKEFEKLINNNNLCPRDDTNSMKNIEYSYIDFKNIFQMNYKIKLNSFSKSIYNYLNLMIFEKANVICKDFLSIKNQNSINEQNFSSYLFRVKIIQLPNLNLYDQYFNNFDDESLNHNFKEDDEMFNSIREKKEKLNRRLNKYLKEMNYDIKIIDNCYPVKKKFVTDYFTEEMKSQKFSKYLFLNNLVFYNSEHNLNMEFIDLFFNNNNINIIKGSIKDLKVNSLSEKIIINNIDYSCNIEKAEKIEFFIKEFLIKNKINLIFCIGNSIDSDIKEILIDFNIQIFDWLTYENFLVLFFSLFYLMY